jgi:hypothetical protein
LAICRVKDGRVESQCVDKPSIKQSLPQRVKEAMLKNWALGLIKGEQRGPTEEISHQDNSILRSGSYYSAEAKETVTFSLPVEIKIKTPAPVAAG